MSITVKRLIIDPESAASMLEQNTHNRPLRSRIIDALAADIADGNWMENGETVKVAPNGDIVDGQHRLHAIVKADRPVPLLIAFNVPMPAQETVDTGARRTFADVLQLRDVPHTNTVAATARALWQWDRGVRRGSGGFQPTVAQLSQVLVDNPVIPEAAASVEKIYKRLRIQKSVLGLCYILFYRIDPEDCLDFFEKLYEGAGLSVNDPISVFRNTVIAGTTTRGVGKISRTLMTVYLIKTWNAYRAGDETRLLRWRAGGARPEEFPEPK